MLKTKIKSLPEKHNFTWIEMRLTLLVKIKRAGCLPVVYQLYWSQNLQRTKKELREREK